MTIAEPDATALHAASAVMPSRLMVLATGGTIAGRAPDPSNATQYQAAQTSAADLLAAVPALAAVTPYRIEAEQIAQVDSKDMSHALWQRLAQAVEQHLAQPDVAAIVITHGTDTLEETAYFLHRVLHADKPVVLTAAMRPANALGADGPQNLVDAVRVASTDRAAGVMVAVGGNVWHPAEVRKVHSHHLDAFNGGDAGPVALVAGGQLRRWRDWPSRAAGVPPALTVPVEQWPRVAVLMSHASVDGDVVRALQALGYRGVVVAGTGNGTVHEALEQALRAAQAQGLVVWRSTRCALGGVLGADHAHTFPGCGDLTPGQARVALMLHLMAEVA